MLPFIFPVTAAEPKVYRLLCISMRNKPPVSFNRGGIRENCVIALINFGESHMPLKIKNWMPEKGCPGVTTIEEAEKS